MLERYWIFICLMYVVLASTSWAQESKDISRLVAQLNEPKTTDRASRRIVQVASKDLEARNYVINKLIEIIGKNSTDQVWMNAVRLAGQLNAVEAVPSLQRAFSRGQLGRPGNTMLGTEMQLDDDVVGKALGEIGDPSVPAVTNLLKSGDPKVRRRAVVILMYIDSPAAHKVLRGHRPVETDPKLKGLIGPD
jgi:HEAT repeat protein